MRQEASENAGKRQLSGRGDPNFHDEIVRRLDGARSRWIDEVSVPSLRSALLVILQKLERG